MSLVSFYIYIGSKVKLIKLIQRIEITESTLRIESSDPSGPYTPKTSVIAIMIADQGSSASEVESSHSDSQELLYLYPSDIGTL